MPEPFGPSGSEGLGELDQALEDALGEFDEMVQGEGGGGEPSDIDILDPMAGGPAQPDPNDLLAENTYGGESESDSPMQENQGHAQRAQSGGGSSSSSAASSGSQGAQGSQQSGSQSQSSSQASNGESQGSGAGAAPPESYGQASGASVAGSQGADEVIPIPDDVGDGRDDDIVLKQLRQAALQEKDPVLRDRLWDEYRRIRAGR
ncbi:MAG: hypothetical protein AAGH19_04145 [Pseudomonadota bacterium]